MDDDIISQLESPEQFWDELNAILVQGERDQDMAQRSIDLYVNVTTKFQDEYLKQDMHLERCCYALLDSIMFRMFSDKAIERLIYLATTLLDLKQLWVIYNTLFLAGKENSQSLKLMLNIKKYNFIQKLKRDICELEEGHCAQKIAANLLFEICRVQRLSQNELNMIDEKFLNHLLDMVENTRDEEDETFNYSIIRLLLSFNEQFMLAAMAHHAIYPDDDDDDWDHNTLLRVLSMRIGTSKTFGENVIFMLNRAVEPHIQMLILKLLYEIFITPETCEYFYTNDLHVLIDVFIRELCDLPEESEALRHTYLRVLYPLLANTQLNQHRYKQHHIYSLLLDLVGSSTKQFKPVSPTTQRLVNRCLLAEYFEGIVTVHKRSDGIKRVPSSTSVMFPMDSNGIFPINVDGGSTGNSNNGVNSQGKFLHTTI